MPGRNQGSRLQGRASDSRGRDGTKVPGFSGYQESVDPVKKSLLGSVKRKNEQGREDVVKEEVKAKKESVRRERSGVGSQEQDNEQRQGRHQQRPQHRHR